MKKKLLLRKIAKQYSIYFGVFFVILAASEGLLKIFSPILLTGYIGNYEYHPVLGATLKEGYWSKTTDYKQEVFVNRLGSVNPQESFGNYKKLAFALGDSYTQGTGSPLSSSYPAYADLLVNTSDGIYSSNLGIVNLGTAANGGLQNIKNYYIFSEKLRKPDFVFYLGCDNDYIDDIRYSSGHRHWQLVDDNPNFGILLKPLQILSGFELTTRLKLLKGHFVRLSMQNRINPNFRNAEKCVSVAEHQISNLETLKNLSNKEGFKLIVGWVQNPEANSSLQCSSYYWLKDWAAKNNISFADYLPSAVSTRKNWTSMPSTHDHSGGHFRAWMNLLIAKSFVKHVKVN